MTSQMTGHGPALYDPKLHATFVEVMTELRGKPQLSADCGSSASYWASKAGVPVFEVDMGPSVKRNRYRRAIHSSELPKLKLLYDKSPNAGRVSPAKGKSRKGRNPRTPKAQPTGGGEAPRPTDRLQELVQTLRKAKLLMKELRAEPIELSVDEPIGTIVCTTRTTVRVAE